MQPFYPSFKSEQSSGLRSIPWSSHYPKLVLYHNLQMTYSPSYTTLLLHQNVHITNNYRKLQKNNLLLMHLITIHIRKKKKYLHTCTHLIHTLKPVSKSPFWKVKCTESMAQESPFHTWFALWEREKESTGSNERLKWNKGTVQNVNCFTELPNTIRMNISEALGYIQSEDRQLFTSESDWIHHDQSTHSHCMLLNFLERNLE